ncbi:MAG: SDR family oxidoreductase [bacterium]|nr:SDR family oxidoreductase [bacterium]
MEIKFHNKIILVTGSTRGIGKEIARAFGEAGGNIIINSRREEAVEDTVDEFRKSGYQAVGYAADVGSWDSVKKLMEFIGATHKRLDVIVNNAGISFPLAGVSEMAVEDWDNILKTNLSGPFFVAKAGLPLMQYAGGGSIINIGSMAYLLQIGSPNPAYSAAKGGLVSLTKALVKDCSPHKIRVNAISPWYVKNDKFDDIFKKAGIDQNYAAERNPLGRTALPADISSLALFLASDHASFISGQVIHVSGAAEVLIRK